MRYLLFISLSLVLLSISQAQIREVKSKASAYKSSTNSSETWNNSNSSSNAGSTIIFELIEHLIVNPIVYVFEVEQKDQIDRNNTENWVVSAELNLRAGTNLSQVGYFDSQSIRGNYGLFSSEIRRINLKDVGGSFTTFDWQIMQFNLFNEENFRWLFGLGFSHELDIDQTHAEFATEMNFSLFGSKIMPALTYRISGDGYPRKEFSSMLSYRPFRSKKNEIAFQAGYTYQSLYDIAFKFASFGLCLYLK